MPRMPPDRFFSAVIRAHAQRSHNCLRDHRLGELLSQLTQQHAVMRIAQQREKRGRCSSQKVLQPQPFFDFLWLCKNPSKSNEKCACQSVVQNILWNGFSGFLVAFAVGLSMTPKLPGPPGDDGVVPPMRDGPKTTLPLTLKRVHALPFVRRCLQDFATFLNWATATARETSRLADIKNDPATLGKLGESFPKLTLWHQSSPSGASPTTNEES